jgi:hypothetical protein
MINMKYIQYITLCLIGLSLVACYEQDNPIDDLYQTDGRELPAIAGWELVEEDLPDLFTPGTEITADLRYWSVPEVTEVRFIEVIGDTESTVESRPYTLNFNEQSQTDQMVFSYTTPAVADTTTVTLVAEVENEDNLVRRTGTGGSATRPSISITVVP